MRWIALPGLQDTQCGFKLFRDDVAEKVFRRQTIFGWTFDVEVLYIARLHGYHITEIGVPWYYNAEFEGAHAAGCLGYVSGLECASGVTAGAEFMMRRLPKVEVPKHPDLRFEIPLWESGFTAVAGLDEAGRGAWAGPVAAGAVILPVRCTGRRTARTAARRARFQGDDLAPADFLG